ncbi:hypothetical protein [Nonomuraea bangladeshensis]|uniref:hypothetical protein n=1 Tax=Nonomuraea bangladeshensis TaxID=404385 RepID=UPI0031CE5D66
MASTTAVTPARSLVPDDRGRFTRLRLWPAALLLGWLAHVVLRVLLGIQHAVPLLIPDESGYLLAARLLSGGAGSDMSGRTFYQGGYPLLIAPAYWFSDDPQIVYRLAIGINALVGAGLLLLAYVAFRRMDLPRGKAYLLAHATALLPSAVYYSQFVLTDAVLPVLVLGWLLLLHRWLAGGGRLHGLAAGALIAFGFGTHSRGIILLLVHLGLLAVVAVRRLRPARGDVPAMAAVTVAGAGAGWLLNAWLQRRIYPGGVAPLGEWLSDRLTSWDGLAWTLSVATGQLWHVSVATFGVTAVGLLALTAVALRRAARPQDRLLAAATVAAVAGVALATSAALPSEDSVANLAYGRYLACLAPALFIVGLVVLTHVRKEVAARAGLAAAGLTLVAGAVVHLHAGERLYRDFFGVFDFVEISFITANWDSLSLDRATLTTVAVIGLAVLAAGRARRRPWLIVLAVSCVAAELAIAGVTVAKVSAPWGRILAFATDLRPAGLRPDDRVGVYYPGLHWRIWVSQAFQVPTKLVPMDLYRADWLDPRVTLVVVPWTAGTDIERTWPAAPPGWRPVTSNVNDAGNWVAWRHVAKAGPAAVTGPPARP